jgi:5-methylcytosine-specific restriction endonuclease McrA
VVEPLTATLRRLHLTVSRHFLEKLASARDALSHASPDATDEQILEAGLDLVLAQHAKRKGLVEKPRREPAPSTTDRIPAHVKREVWKRDGGKCQYRLPNGELCGSTRRVEFHHRHARGLGGPPTTENIELHCKFHNLLEGRRDFGDGVMDRYARDPRKPELAREPVALYGAAPRWGPAAAASAPLAAAGR